MYVNFTAGNKEYKLKLSIRNIVMLEKQLGVNPLMIFGNGDRMPTITEMTYILHASLQQYQHNISLLDAQDIFEAWMNDGNNPTDFISIIVDIYKVSGIIRDEGNDEKNV
jgi:hypothetical protein